MSHDASSESEKKQMEQEVVPATQHPVAVPLAPQLERSSESLDPPRMRKYRLMQSRKYEPPSREKPPNINQRSDALVESQRTNLVGPHEEIEVLENDPSFLGQPVISDNLPNIHEKIEIGEPESKDAKRAKPMPPDSILIEPFQNLRGLDTLEPAREEPTGWIEGQLKSHNDPQDILNKPICSLNIICYSQGCTVGQVVVSLRNKFDSEDTFNETVVQLPELILTDEELFLQLRKEFHTMCGFWRRNFSLKTLHRLRLLSYATESIRPIPVPMDDLTMQEVLYAFNHPPEVGSGTDWIEWVFRLRQPDKRHALEFVEGWNGARIAIVGLVPCLASTLVGVIWSVRSGDIQTAFTVAGFILTVATALIALLAIVSGIDSNKA